MYSESLNIVVRKRRPFSPKFVQCIFFVTLAVPVVDEQLLENRSQQLKKCEVEAPFLLTSCD